MSLKQLLSASVIVATLPAATCASEWDADLTGLKAGFAAAAPAPTSFDGLTTASLLTTGSDGKKKLSVASFLEFVQSKNMVGGKYKKDLDMTPAAYAAFNKADANGDLHLNADEWNSLMANLRPNHDSKFTTWMESNQFPTTFDTEFNAGTHDVARQIYSNKVTGIATTGLKAVAQARSATAFDKADANDDQKLTREEFKTLVADNNVGGGKDAFENWVKRLAGEASSFGAQVHADKLEDRTDTTIDVNSDDEITEDACIKWLAPPANNAYDVDKVLKAAGLCDSWDTDNSKALSKTEIANAWAKLQRANHIAANPPFTANSDDWAKAGHGLLPPVNSGVFDKNDDDKVSLTEFLVWAKSKDTTEGIVPQIVKAFNQADKNGDMALDSNELKVMLATMSPTVTASDPIVADTSSCFTNDVDYWGHDLHTFMGKGSVTSCQQSCRTVNGANYFQFEPATDSKPSVCWCKSARGGEKPHAKRTVGPIVCPGGVGLWESRVVDKPTNGVAIVGAVMGAGSLAMALVMWLAGKRFSGRPQQMEAVPLQVQE